MKVKHSKANKLIHSLKQAQLHLQTAFEQEKMCPKKYFLNLLKSFKRYPITALAEG